jgi:hypothetical protein
MRLKTVPARQGLMWVRAGLRTFGRQPLGYASLFAVFGLGVFVLLQIPLLGSLLALAAMPLLTMAFLLGTREALAGRPPSPALLLPLWRDAEQRKRLLQLGAVYAAATVLVILLAHVLDGGRFSAAAAALAEQQSSPEAALQDPALAWALLLRAGLFSVLSLLFWHTPALMCWGGMPLAKAMFANLVACWRSRGALAAFGLTWFALMALFMIIVQTLFAALGLGAVMAQAVLPMALLASTAFYASLYFSFIDTFDLEDSVQPPLGNALIG